MDLPLEGLLIAAAIYMILFRPWNMSAPRNASSELALRRRMANDAATWRALIDRAVECREAGDADGEEKALQAALDKSLTLGEDTPFYITSLSAMSSFRAARGEHAMAGSLTLKAFEVSKATRGENDPTTVRLMLDRAYLHTVQGRTVPAVTILEQALAAAQSREPEDVDLVCEVLIATGRLAEMRNDPEATAAAFERAVDVGLGALDSDRQPLFQAVSMLGAYYLHHERHAELERLSGRLLDEVERRLPPDDPYRPVAFGNHAFSMYIQGRMPEAASLYRRGLDVHASVEDAPVADRLALLNGLANSVWCQGGVEEAEGLCSRALEEGAAAGLAGSPEMEELLRTLSRIQGAEDVSM